MFYGASKCVYLFCTSYEIFFHIGCAHASFLCYCLVLMSSLSLSLSLSQLSSNILNVNFFRLQQRWVTNVPFKDSNDVKFTCWKLYINYKPFYILFGVEYLDIIGYHRNRLIVFLNTWIFWVQTYKHVGNVYTKQ